jgi:hypothetical protein
MKHVNLFLGIIFAFSFNNVKAQSDDQLKLENLKYYLASLKDNVQSMRYYTDSTKVLSLLDQIEVITANVEAEVEKIVVPESEMPQTTIETTEGDEVPIFEEEAVEVENYPDVMNNGDNGQDGGIGLSKYMPFKKKFNTNLKIEFGVNSLLNNLDEVAGITYPEINTGGSWYWDFALVRSARLGGKDSKVALNYGISFLKNRFKLENDVLLTTNASGNPAFINIENVKENPKLNVGYLNIPLSFTFALSKKSKLELGGYAGYRVHTVQKNHLKVGKENIHEQRYARHELNNWVYGAKASIDISGFRLVGRYNFSKLFNDNPSYDYNTFMIGTSVSLF